MLIINQKYCKNIKKLNLLKQFVNKLLAIKHKYFSKQKNIIKIN